MLVATIILVVSVLFLGYLYYRDYKRDLKPLNAPTTKEKVLPKDGSIEVITPELAPNVEAIDAKKAARAEYMRKYREKKKLEEKS